MQKIITALLALCVFLSGCVYDRTAGVTNVPDRTPVKLINVKGYIYYDTGINSKNTPRCGTLDGQLIKACGEYEVPAKSNQSNFDLEKDYFGYQNASDITVEVPMESGWRIFKKIESLYYGNENQQSKNFNKYKYGFKITEEQEEYLVLSNEINADRKEAALVTPIGITDSWGIKMYADNITPQGITLYLEQLGGQHKGNLQTGAAYTLEVFESGKWKEAETKDGHQPVWSAVAFKINEQGITKWNVDFKFTYNDLTAGKYRIGKKIMDHIQPGEYTEKTYYAEFEVK